MSDLTNIAFCRNLPSLTSATKLPDALLSILISSCSRAIERFCNRTFAQTTYTDQILDGSGERSMILPNFPLVSLSALAIRDFSNVWNDVDITQIEFDTDPLLSDGEISFVTNASSIFVWFPKSRRNIKLTYVAGFSAIPQDVQMGCALWIAHAFQSSKKDQTKQSEQIGKYSYSNNPTATVAANPQFSAYPPDECRRFLSSYRKVTI